ncbi:MAG: hypothetical protein ACR2QB_08665 [Gammaproteobacteria bacterium]
MNLSSIADVADLLAALGVIVSLIYVGYQLKQTRKAGRAATAQARTDLGVQLISARWTTDIADLLVRSVDDPGSLSKAEKFKLKGFFTAHVRHCMNMFYQQREGFLDDYWSYGIARVTVYWIKNYPLMQSEWESLQKTLPPEFAGFINAESQNSPPGEYV